MTRSNERGSALIITLMLLLILTAIGIYAISISTTEMSIALQSKAGTAVLNSADSGANFGIDQIPSIFTTSQPGTLLDGSSLRLDLAGDGQHDAQARIRVQLPVRGFRGDEHRNAASPVRRPADGSGRGQLRAGARGDDVLNVVSPLHAKGESR